eukprot:TRINITY_DN1036_c0_g2_i8.p1 TRINITY_DN1036_c0_g2~~TRINITY_DN1036_c0_g2_i8.p1  ORF type:complete len:113 (-),score=29.02 TRINITY_DN1036_c0_g2_i8:699-995(-)
MGKKRPANPFLDSKISNIYSEPKIRPTPTLSKKEVEPIVDLKSIQREVFDLGATTFRGKQKREWENQRLRARGGIVLSLSSLLIFNFFPFVPTNFCRY